jgi:sugar phosphate isomerase/epimerase
MTNSIAKLHIMQLDLQNIAAHRIIYTNYSARENRMVWNVALSTMWGIGQFDHLADFFAAGQHIGIQQFELNHKVTSTMLNGLDLTRYRIDSVHEPCPTDLSTDTLNGRNWLISALDEDCRRQGVRAVQRSIDLAHRLGARTVVVHAGRVDLDQQLEDPLWRLFEAGQAHMPAYDEARDRLITARGAQAEANLEAVHRSLVELAEYAGRLGIGLGIENRYHYREIPSSDELGRLLETVGDERVGFWYDVGHAHTLERLGFYTHTEWLERYASRMVGVHFHDVIGLTDHQAPGSGEVDWKLVSKYLPNHGIIRACEVRPYVTSEQTVAGLQFLADQNCIARLGNEGGNAASHRTSRQAPRQISS